MSRLKLRNRTPHSIKLVISVQRLLHNSLLNKATWSKAQSQGHDQERRSKLALESKVVPVLDANVESTLSMQVTGEIETKVCFKTVRRDVVYIRSFQLTQKASKMEYKAIESVLQTINPQNGEGRSPVWAGLGCSPG
ncbi:hypothetical protein ACFE04_027207 [Oxalis oulophora]